MDDLAFVFPQVAKNARALLVFLGLLAVALASPVKAADGSGPLRGQAPPLASTIEVPRWEMHEFSVKARARAENPFRDARLVGEFVSPSGNTNVLEAFYDGDDLWRLRFAPEEEGVWNYLLRGEGVEVDQRGKMRCTKARGRGFIRTHPENPYAFAYADGSPFFPMGDTCYGLFDDSPITPELRREYLKTRRAQRFNFVRMSVGHSEARAATNAAYWAWGGTPQKPDPPWRIGEFFGAEGAMDVLSQQTGALGEGLIWDEPAQCWNGDPTNLVASLRADRRFKKPVLNTENGYEYLRGHPTEKKQVHHTDKVRRSAWRIVCAGGYFAAGFHGTIGHSDVWNRIDAPNHYTFTIRDEGAAAQLAVLHDFFLALPFWTMQPFADMTGDALALADPGTVYVAYFPHGGAISMDLAPGPLTTRWFNPRAGEFGSTMSVTAIGPRQKFAAPDTNDWALVVRRGSLPLN